MFHHQRRLFIQFFLSRALADCGEIAKIPRFVSAGNYRPASLVRLTPPPDWKQVFEDIIIIIIKETRRKLVAI